MSGEEEETLYGVYNKILLEHYVRCTPLPSTTCWALCLTYPFREGCRRFHPHVLRQPSAQKTRFKHILSIFQLLAFVSTRGLVIR